MNWPFRRLPPICNAKKVQNLSCRLSSFESIARVFNSSTTVCNVERGGRYPLRAVGRYVQPHNLGRNCTSSAILVQIMWLGGGVVTWGSSTVFQHNTLRCVTAARLRVPCVNVQRRRRLVWKVDTAMADCSECSKGTWKGGGGFDAKGSVEPFLWFWRPFH